jgi:hypothetical protein
LLPKIPVYATRDLGARRLPALFIGGDKTSADDRQDETRRILRIMSYGLFRRDDVYFRRDPVTGIGIAIEAGEIAA